MLVVGPLNADRRKQAIARIIGYQVPMRMQGGPAPPCSRSDQPAPGAHEFANSVQLKVGLIPHYDNQDIDRSKRIGGQGNFNGFVVGIRQPGAQCLHVHYVRSYRGYANSGRRLPRCPLQCVGQQPSGVRRVDGGAFKIAVMTQRDNPAFFPAAGRHDRCAGVTGSALDERERIGPIDAQRPGQTGCSDPGDSFEQCIDILLIGHGVLSESEYPNDSCKQ